MMARLTPPTTYNALLFFKVAPFTIAVRSAEVDVDVAVDWKSRGGGRAIKIRRVARQARRLAVKDSSMFKHSKGG